MLELLREAIIVRTLSGHWWIKIVNQEISVYGNLKRLIQRTNLNSINENLYLFNINKSSIVIWNTPSRQNCYFKTERY